MTCEQGDVLVDPASFDILEDVKMLLNEGNLQLEETCEISELHHLVFLDVVHANLDVCLGFLAVRCRTDRRKRIVLTRQMTSEDHVDQREKTYAGKKTYKRSLAISCSSSASLLSLSFLLLLFSFNFSYFVSVAS